MSSESDSVEMQDQETSEKFVVVDMPVEGKSEPRSPEKLRKMSVSKISNAPSTIPLPILQRNPDAKPAASRTGRSNSLNILQPHNVPMPTNVESKARFTEDLPRLKNEIKTAQSMAAGTISIQGQSNTLLDANVVLSTKLSAAEEDIKIIVQKLNETEASLREAHDTIFQLQPYHQGITESDAASEFATLVDGIQSWIFNNLGDALDDRRVLTHHKIDFIAAGEFASLLTPAGREAMDIPDTDEWNITAIVMRFLMHEVFEKELCGVVPDDQLEFLHGIERSMACLEPRRDLTTTRTWLTTTLHALTSTPHYPSLLPPRLKGLATQLTKMLRLFTPNPKVTPPLELRQAVLSGIIEPAVALAHRLHLSPHIYAVDFSAYAKKYEKTRERQLPPVVGELGGFDAVDMMRSGRTVKTEDFIAKDGSLVQTNKQVIYVMDLCPGLFVQTVKGDVLADRKALKKPRAVVAVTEVDGLDEENQFPPQFEEGEEGTLVGYLYSRVLQRQQSERERIGFGWMMRHGNDRS